MSNQAGKGDTPRPVDGEKFRANYDSIFRKSFTREELERAEEIAESCRDKEAADRVGGNFWANI
jgi:hypothetical protein